MGADDYLTKAVCPARTARAHPLGYCAGPRMLPRNLQDRSRPASCGSANGSSIRPDVSGRRYRDVVSFERRRISSVARISRSSSTCPQSRSAADLTQGREAEVFDRSVDLLVSRLGQRLPRRRPKPCYIKTVRSEATSLLPPRNIAGGRHECRFSSYGDGASLAAVMFGRLAIILFSGLAAAHVLSFVLILFDHSRAVDDFIDRLFR